MGACVIGAWVGPCVTTTGAGVGAGGGAGVGKRRLTCEFSLASGNKETGGRYSKDGGAAVVVVVTGTGLQQTPNWPVKLFWHCCKRKKRWIDYDWAKKEKGRKMCAHYSRVWTEKWIRAGRGEKSFWVNRVRSIKVKVGCRSNSKRFVISLLKGKRGSWRCATRVSSKSTADDILLWLPLQSWWAPDRVERCRLKQRDIPERQSRPRKRARERS